MTDKLVEALEPTQADRDAALRYYLYTRSLSGNDYRVARATNDFMSGSKDQTETVQAFARHRVAALASRPDTGAEKSVVVPFFPDDHPPAAVAGEGERTWHCNCCRSEFQHAGDHRPNCPNCKAWDQYTYQGSYPAQRAPKKRVPTPAEINALPDHVRNYVMMLETDSDPSGTVRSEMYMREDLIPALEAKAALSQPAGDALRDALKCAVSHIEHMAAWIGKQRLGYSFESLGEDMPGIKAALAPTKSPDAECDVKPLRVDWNKFDLAEAYDLVEGVRRDAAQSPESSIDSSLRDALDAIEAADCEWDGLTKSPDTDGGEA